ncbi:MAG: tetratricopeptide repeat protein [Bdellovibrionales bacterium]
MNLFNPFLIRKYKSLLAKNPKSKIFCPIAQIYRMSKEFEKARKICLKGIQENPTYATGYIVLAKIYKDQNKIDLAFKSLNKAKELSPDNYQIYQLFGEIYREKKDLEKTLSAFKMVSFLKPWDQTAKKTVQHLENTVSRKDQWIQKSQSPLKTPMSYSLEQSRSSQKLQKLQKLLAKIEMLYPEPHEESSR